MYTYIPQVASIYPSNKQLNNGNDKKRNNLLKIIDDKFSTEDHETEILKDLVREYITVLSTENELFSVIPIFCNNIKQTHSEMIYESI